MTVQENYKVVLPNMNLFADRVNEYYEFRDHCHSSLQFAICVQTNQERNTVMYEHRECKCLPPCTNENKTNFEQSTNRKAKQKGRLERNNLSSDQVNFMSQFKNLPLQKDEIINLTTFGNETNVGQI